VRPSLFEADFRFIRYLGASTDFHEAQVDLLNFWDVKRTFLRTSLRIRVSGRKAARLVQEFFGPSME
jgi:hypothetical protein